ncbi:TetR/AcrR family transcriptional regulator [Kitasatospora sp. NPDC015120]|uniref:TetR/AcrR family transcriptional regulator n=1 Tax=Kitasatospora sp. NPDC015120 TaxID=3364023 RepID=UPI0036F483F5
MRPPPDRPHRPRRRPRGPSRRRPRPDRTAAADDHPPGRPHPQQDRSRATRARLPAAAVGRLAALGWNGSTGAVVAGRAGVSRGTARHHVPTREDTAAVDLTAERPSAVRAHADALPDAGPARPEAVLDRVVRRCTGPLLRAALHLWAATVTEEPPRERITGLEGHAGRQAHRAAVEFLGADGTRPGVREPCRPPSAWPAAPAPPTCSPATAPGDPG